VNSRVKLGLMVGAGVVLGYMSFNGFRFIRLNNAVDDLIDDNPDLFGSSSVGVSSTPFTF